MRKITFALKSVLLGLALSAVVSAPMASASSSEAVAVAAPTSAEIAAAPCGLARIPTQVGPIIAIRWFYRNCTPWRQLVSARYYDGHIGTWCLPIGEHYIGASPLLTDVWMTHPEGAGNVC